MIDKGKEILSCFERINREGHSDLAQTMPSSDRSWVSWQFAGSVHHQLYTLSIDIRRYMDIQLANDIRRDMQ